MLKNKIFSLMLTVAMLITTLVVPPVASADGTGTDTPITINSRENRIFDASLYTEYGDVYITETEETPKATNGIDIKTSTQINAEKFPTDGIVVSYKFTVPTDGAYKLTKLTGGDITTTLSKYAVAVDDLAMTKIDNTVVKTTTAFPVPENDTENASYYAPIKIYTTDITYNLTAGEHTFKYIIYKHNTDRNRTWASFHSAELTNVNGTVYGTDKYTEKSANMAITTPNQVDGNQTWNGNVTAFKIVTDETYSDLSVKYSFYIPADGMYALNLTSGRYDKDHLSPYSVRVDNGVYVPVGADTSASTTEDTTVPAHIAHIKLKNLFNLTKGNHTFEFKITDKVKNGGRYVQFLESAKFVQATEQEIEEYNAYLNAAKTITVNAQTGYIYDENQCSEYGTVLLITSNDTVAKNTNSISLKGGTAETANKFPTNGIVVNYKINVLNEGLYELSTLAGGCISNASVSNYGIAIDDGPVKKIYAGNATVAEVLQSGVVEKYTTNLKYYLTAGEHTFKYVVYEHCADQNRTFAYFTKAELKYVESPNYSTVVYGQDLCEKSSVLTLQTNNTAITNNSKNITYSANGDATAPLSAKYKFEVYKDGEYVLNLVTGKSATHLSPYSIKVDDKTVEIKNENLVGVKDNAEISLQMMDAKVKDKFNLTKGTHTFEIILTDKRTVNEAKTNYLQFFESATFSEEEGLGEVSVSLDRNVIDRSGFYNTAQLTVSVKGDKTGAEITPDEIIYSSDNEYVATVDSWGFVEVPLNGLTGKATISAEVVLGEARKTKTVEIVVTDGNVAFCNAGFYNGDDAVTSVTSSLTKLTAKAEFYNNTGETISNVTAYLAIYDGDGNLVNVTAQKSDMQKGNNNIYVEAEDLSLSSEKTYKAKLFLWASDLQPYGNTVPTI